MTDLSLSLLLGLTRRYPLVRGRDFFYRNFVKGKPLQARLAQLPNPAPTRRGFGIFCNAADLTSDWIKVWGEHETVTEKFLLHHLRGGGAAPAGIDAFTAAPDLFAIARKPTAS